MISIAIAVATWALLLGWIIRSEGWPNEAISWVLCSALAALTCVASIGVATGIATAIGSALPSAIDTKPSHTATLVALRSSDGVEGSFRGSFFLGVGHIGSQLYYFWYEQSGNAVTPRQHAAGVGTYVYEEDRAMAEVRVFDWHFKRAWWGWFAFEGFGKTWEFHVPKGTVKHGYSL